jgi:hypothetical protein
MRKRLHYTPNQITTGLYTTGSQWMTEDGTEFVGPYHTYITGEIFSQSKWNEKTSKKLIPLVVEKSDNHVYKQLKTVRTKFETPQAVQPIITLKDRSAGFITRYFFKKTNNHTITEVDETQYDKWGIQKIDPNIWYATKIIWSITGNLHDEMQHGVIVPGVIEKNLQEIQRAEVDVPGISLILTNPVQYYSDTDFVVPKDINS